MVVTKQFPRKAEHVCGGGEMAKDSGQIVMEGRYKVEKE